MYDSFWQINANSTHKAKPNLLLFANNICFTFQQWLCNISNLLWIITWTYCNLPELVHPSTFSCWTGVGASSDPGSSRCHHPRPLAMIASVKEIVRARPRATRVPVVEMVCSGQRGQLLLPSLGHLITDMQISDCSLLPIITNLFWYSKLRKWFSKRCFIQDGVIRKNKY